MNAVCLWPCPLITTSTVLTVSKHGGCKNSTATAATAANRLGRYILMLISHLSLEIRTIISNI
jgi:hypothetical protein